MNMVTTTTTIRLRRMCGRWWATHTKISTDYHHQQQQQTMMRLDLYVRLMNEEAFSFMITRAQQARIYAAHAARAPESTPESTPEP